MRPEARSEPRKPEIPRRQLLSVEEEFALYSLAATLSRAGRSATTMTMLGYAVVGQAVDTAVTGALAHRAPGQRPAVLEKELVAA